MIFYEKKHILKLKLARENNNCNNNNIFLSKALDEFPNCFDLY